MKKLLLIMLALIIAGLALAQTDVTIGTGTSTGRYPLNDYYVYSRSQCIYLESEIGAPGTIHKLRWFRNDTGANASAIGTTQIWLKTVSNAVMTDVNWEDPGTMVAEISNIDLGAGNAWYEIDITDFAYSGGNLLVSAYTQNAPYTTPHAYWRYTTTTGFNRCRLGNSDSSNPPTLSLSTARPNIQINMTAGAPSVAPNPAILAAPMNGGYAMIGDILSWNSGGGFPATYDVYLDTVDGSTLVSDNQTGLTYAPTLASGTTYYWKVVPANGFGDAAGCPVWSFMTPGATQLAESFENTAFPPAGWANGTTGNWTRSTSYAKHGTASAYKYGSSTTAYVLSTPRLTIEATSTLNLWTLASGTTGTLQVVYSPDRVTWTPLGTPIAHAATYTWYNTVADLSSLAGNNYYLGVQTGLQAVNFYTDLYVGPAITPEAPGPVTLSTPADAAINVSEYPTFTWTAPVIGGAPTGYAVYCSTSNPPNYTTDLIGSTGAGVLTFTATTALAYNTAYYWTVKAFNGTGDATMPALRSFTTRANPTISTFPWEVNFGTLAADWPVLNWSQLVNQYPNALVAGTRWYQDDFVNVTTPLNKAAKMNVWSANFGWIVTPPIAIPAPGYELKFDVGLTAYGSTSAVTAGGQPDDKFMVLVSDSPMMTNPTILKEWNNSGSANVYDAIPNTGQNHIIDLDAYVGTKYFAFYGESSVSNGDNDLFVDNVIVRETPAAPIFTYAPNAIDFGTMMQNVAATAQNVVISNTGGGTINLSMANISIIGTDSAMFSYVASNLPATLAGGQSVNIPVTVTVTSEGAKTATLRITWNAVNYDVALSANGLPAGLVVIGNGTADLDLPINPYFGYTYSQSIFLQSEINVPNQRIESVYYYWNGVAEAVDSNDWTIYMGHTAATEFTSTTDWMPLANLSTVFSGTIALPATAGWIEIPLTAPFIYNNTDNLVIAVDENAPSYDGSSEFFYSTAAATNRSIRHYSDTVNCDPAAPVAGTQVMGYPNVMLTFGDIPAGVPEAVTLTYPANAATGLPVGGFDLTWAPALTGGVPTGYTVYIGTTEGTIYDENSFNVTNTHFNPVTEGLMTFNFLDRYYWTVEATNADGSAVVDPPFSFEIQADPRISLPYTQDFGTGTTMPLNWTQTSTGANVWTVSATANAGGTASEMKATWTSLDGVTRLITPPINTTGMSMFQVMFNHLFDDFGTGITAKLQYSHDLTTWTDTQFSIISGGGNVSGLASGLINGINAPVTYVAWVLDGNHYQFDYWYVDNVSLTLPAEHDVSMVSWDVPVQVVSPNTLVTPQVTVANNGINTETFTVTCEIGTYTNTQTVTGLAMGQTQQVTFANLTPVIWTAENVTVYTTLATDEVAANNTLTDALICLDLDTPALANNAQTDQFVQFNLSDPGTLNPLPTPYTGAFFMSGADWMNGAWMGVEYDDGTLATDNYYEIDPLTGVYLPSLGEPGQALMGIAWDDTNSIMYGATGTTGQLCTLNPATGLATVLGNMWYNLEGTPTNFVDINGLMIDIAYDNTANILYGIDLGNDALWTINPTTWELTLVGFFGIDLNYAQDAAFDQDNGLLFLAGYSNFGGLYWIDTVNGGAYLVGELGTAGYELDGFAIPYGTLAAAPVVTMSGAGVLSWEPVLGAISYNIYSSNDPYGTFTYETNVIGTSYTNATAAMKFYKVTAVGGRSINNRTPITYSQPMKKAATQKNGKPNYTGTVR